MTNIISLPVGKETMRLNWDRTKFSAIIPVNENSSVLYYDGMKVDLSISASEFTNMMDDRDGEDALKEYITKMMSKYTFKGEFYNELNTSGQAHLQHTSWETEITKVSETKKGPKVWCNTTVSSSFLINKNGTQVTKTVSWTKRHTLDKCKNATTMREYLINRLTVDLRENVALYNDRSRWNDYSDNRRFDMFHKFYIKDITIPVYFYTSVYQDSLVEGAALNVELSRFGGVEQGRSAAFVAGVEAQARIQAARVIAMGPYICATLAEADHNRDYAPKAFPWNRQAYEDKADMGYKKATSMLNGIL